MKISMRRRTLWTAALLLMLPLIPAAARGQEAGNWTSQLVVQPFPSPFLSAWERNPHVAILTVVYTGTAPRDFRIEGRAESLERGFVARALSAPNHFAGGPSTQIFSSQEIMNWYTVESDQAVFDQVLRTGVLPEGRYRLCARVLDNADVMLTEGCAEFSIELPAPPQLIAPADRSVVSAAQPVFQWTPVIVPPELGVTYRLRVVERLPFQTPSVALETNRPVREEDIAGAPLLVWPQDALPLEEGREYVWQVEALDANGLPITTGARRSEIWAFTPGDPLNPTPVAALPDTLVLVPGVALLTGVSGVHASQFGTTYTLDGDLRLEMLTPQHVALDVRAEALTLDAATLPLPSWESGRLIGELTQGALPAGPVELTTLTYSPVAGLGLRGELRLPDGRAVPLDGELRVTSSGLRGTLSAGGGAQPLAVLGGEPVRYELRELAFTYPEATAEAEGRLELLGREAAGCGRVDFTPGAHGPFTAMLDCTLDSRFELAPAAGGVTLALSRLNGWLSGDWTTGGLAYDLGMDGTLDVTPPGSGTYRFDVGVRAKDGTAQLNRIVATAAGAGTGVLALEPGTTVAPRFEYRAGGEWDFELRFRGSPSLPQFPALALPYTELVVDREGVSLGGFNATFASAATAELAGFVVRPLAASLAPVQVRWSDGVSVDASLTADLEVGFAVGTPQPLAGVRLIGRGLGYRDGAWTGTLRAQAYEPRLELRFEARDDVRFRLSSLEGELSGSAGEQVVNVAAAGSLLVPEYMRCGTQPNGLFEIGNGALSLNSRGMLGGSVTLGDLACPLAFGPLSISARDAVVRFDADGAVPRLELDMAADVRMPGELPGTYAYGSGALGLDLITPAVVRGSVDITSPFRLDLPAADPLLSFLVQRARLSPAGFTLTGSGALTLATPTVSLEEAGQGEAGPSIGEATRVSAEFDALTLSLPRLHVSSGSARVRAPVGFELSVGENQSVAWRAVAPVAGATPLELVVDAQGAHLDGTAGLTLDVLERQLALALDFTSGFRLAVDSGVAVRAGRGSVRLDTAEVAYIDSTGFWLTGNLEALGELFPDFQLPERLPLPTEDIAYLELQPNGVPAVEVSFGPGGVQLQTRANQSVDLVVPALAGGAQPPTLATRFALTIDPESHAVTGGSLLVDAGGQVLFTAEQDGLALDVTQLRYAADSLGVHRLTVHAGADVPLVDGQVVRVEGELEYVMNALEGVLRAAAAGDEPLLLLGSDAVRLSVDSARLSLPDLELDVQSALRLFGRDANCAASFSGAWDAEPVLTGTAACAPGIDLPLITDAPDVALRINSISGTVSLDPAASSIAPQLRLAAALTLTKDAAGVRTCGADVALLVNGSGVAVDPASLSVACGGPGRSRGFGWLDAAPGNLTLERLTYSEAAGFDFEARVDLDLQVRELIDVPVIAAVVIDPAGVHLPALDSPVDHAPITLGGFGLAITRVETPAYLLPWSAWQDGELREFELELDATLSLPELPQGYPSCLATSAFPATRVSIDHRRLRLDVAEHTFSPACTITLDAALDAGEESETPAEDAWANPFDAAEQSDEWLAPPLVDAPPMTPAQSAAEYQQEKVRLLALEDSMRNAYFVESCDSSCQAQLDAHADSVREAIFEQRFRRDFGAASDEVVAILRGMNGAGPDTGFVRIFALMDSVRSVAALRLDAVTDCSDGEYYARVFLGIERQRQLLGGADDESDLTPVTEAGARCAQQRKLELVQACQTPSNAAAMTWAVRDALGAQRQQELLGGETDPSVMGQVVDCVNTAFAFDVTRLRQLCSVSPPDSAAISGTVSRLLAHERQLQLVGSGGQPVDYLGDPCGSAMLAAPPEALSDGVPPAYGGGDVAGGRIATVLAGLRSPRAASVDSVAADSASFPVSLQLEKIGGALVVAFGPEPVVEQTPFIEGALVLPSMFECADPSARALPLQSRLRMSAQGGISGTVLGLAPDCPVNLAAVELQVTDASLLFSTKAGEQQALLRASATGSFTAADSAVANHTVTGTGRLEIDLLRARLVDGELAFQGPFTMDLPRVQPLLSLELGRAMLDRSGLHLDGRADLLLEGSATIGSTLEQVTIDPLKLALTDGRVLFDQPFALEVGIGTNDQLGWRAVAAGSTPATQTGARIDLPTQLELSPAGFQASGGGAGHLLYQGQNLATLNATFSNDFRLALNPAGVREGVLDFQLNGSSVAYIDAFGFHPNLLAFGLAALPERLPLPTEQVAWLELRDAAGNLRVDVENVEGGVRIRSLQGPVPLVLPALRLDAAADPRIDVDLDVVLDAAAGTLSSGAIAAQVPQGAPGFDLAAAGLPLALDSILYRNDGSGYQLMLGGRLALFGQPQGAVRLTLDGAGRLSGELNGLALQQSVALVPGSQQLTLDVQQVDGWFDAQLLQRQLLFQLDVAANLQLAQATSPLLTVPAVVRASQNGFQVTQLSTQDADPFTLAVDDAVELTLANLRVPELGYSAAEGWSFELLFDAALRFPQMNQLVVGPVQDVRLGRSGFTIPAIELADLEEKLTVAAIGAAEVGTEPVPYAALLPGLPDTLKFGGFTFTPLAFRMDAVTYDWFAGTAPADWGFGFDFEISLSELHPQAPQGLRDMKLRLLDAGLRNGRPSGRLEKVSFPDSLNLGVARVAAAWGWIMPPPEERPAPVDEEEENDEPVIIHLEVGVDLYSPVPVCPAAARLNVHNDTLSLSSDGWIRGRIQGITPTCPQEAGPFRFEFGTSELRFAAGETKQQLEIFTTGTVHVAGLANDTVSASGMLRFDALAGHIMDGRIELSEPFRWQPADGNPFLTFDVNAAVLDTDGFHFAGAGNLRLEGGATAAVAFNDLTLALPTLEIAAGSVTVQNQIALGTTIDSAGALRWGAFAPSAPRPNGWGFRAVVPSNLVIDATGVGVSGTAAAELSFADTVFQAVDVDFVNDFTIGLAPVGIRSGRANFRYNQSLVAHADSLGFWPGDVLAALPVPDTLDLGDRALAYIVLRDPATGLLNVETHSVNGGYQLKSRQNQALPLVVPALAAQNGAAPAVDVALDVVVNQATYQVASGSITATAPANAPPLLSLAHVGVPLDLREVSWAPTGPNGTYALSMDAAVTLPAGMCPASSPLLLEDFAITSGGLSGSMSFGTLTADTSAAAVVTCTPANDLTVELVGAEVVLGGQNPGVQLAGRLRAPLFADSTGAVRPITFDGSLTTAGGLALTVDPNIGKLPLGVATFEPAWVDQAPPLSVVANDDEFTVTLNGIFGGLPALPQDFGLTVSNLRLGTAGISLQGLGLTGNQEIELWAATLRLQPATCNNAPMPALSGSYLNGVFRVELAGELDFMENTSTFCGLQLASDGTLQLASANLLSEPVVITEDVITLQSLRVENSNLLGTVAVTVPQPIAPAGAPAQLVNFAVTPAGQVTGGGTVVVVNDAAEGLGNDSTEYALGELITVDPRYLGITLDFGAFRQQSRVQVVSDFYVANDQQKLIRLGSLNGQTVNAGLTVGFDGSVAWGNVAMPNPFEFDYDVVRFTLANVSATGTGLDDFTIGFDGGLGLTISQVSGDLDFTGARIHSTGDVEFGTVSGGSFSIAGVAALEVSDFTYIAADTTISISSGGMPSGNTPASGGTTEITVDRLLRFGASINVADAFSGGVDEFLVYRTVATPQTPALTSLIVSGANLDIDGVVDVSADLRYRELVDGFELLVGGSADVLGTAGLTVVGAMEKTTGDLRAGLFLAADGLTGINLTPATPVVGLSGLGGGFFLNPKTEWLDIVKSQSGVTEGAPANWGSTPAGDFAVLLYAALGAPAPPADVLSGKVLLTVMPTAVEINGRVVVLHQDERLFGVGHLVVAGPLNRAKVSGNVRLEAGYAGLLTAEADISFLGGVNASGQPTALLNGNGTLTAVGYLTADGMLAAGPWGFMGGVKVGNLPSLGLISLDSASATVFYVAGPTLAQSEWGGVATITAAAGPIPSISPVKVTLQGAVLAQGLQVPVLYALGEASLNYLAGEWRESVWARISDGGVTAGFGSDPAMREAIERALAIASDIEGQKTAAEDGVGDAPMPTLALSDAELVAVFNNMQTAAAQWNGTSLQQLWSLEIQDETGALVSYDQPLWSARGLMHRLQQCCQLARIAALEDTADARRARLAAARPQVQQRLAAIQATLTAAGSPPAVSLPADGVSASFAPATVQGGVNASGDSTAVITGGPSLSVDVQALAAMNAALLQHQADVAALDQQVQQQIGELNTLLQDVRSVLTATDAGSVVHFAGTYSAAISALEQQYAEHAATLLDLSDQARVEHDSINARQAVFRSQFRAHLDQLVNNPSRARDLRLRALAYNRLKVRDEMQGGTAGVDRFRSITFTDSASLRQQWRALADTAGWQLWHEAGRAGTFALDTTSMRVFGEVKAAGGPQVEALRTAHAQLSSALAPLYDGQVELTGVLHDLVDRYIGWKDGAQGAPSPDPLAAQRQLRSQLAAQLEVPKVTAVTVSSKLTRHLAELDFQWQGTHPSSTYQFLYRDETGADASIWQSLFAGGANGSVKTFRARATHGATAPAHTLQVGVRGGAGFVGVARAPYTVSYSAETSTATYPVYATAGTLKPDSTPAPAPGVSLDGLGIAQNTAWTNDPTGFTAAWSTDDPQSGIAEYQYAVGTAPGDSTLRGWTSAGGRAKLRIEGITLSSNSPVYVSARARNGSGVWSAVGTSLGVRLDQTAPYFGMGASLQPPFLSQLQLQQGLVGWTEQLTMLAPCPVPLPPFPSSGPTISGWSGSVQPWTGTLAGTVSQTGWTGTPPRITLVRPSAADALSGVERYEFRVDTVPTASYTAQGWTYYRGTELTATGAPMDYHRSFHVSLVAIDHAGNASAPIHYGPFTPVDATAPSAPVFCAAAGSQKLAVRIDSLAVDGESGVLGYQYRIRSSTGAVLRGWPASGTDWTGVQAGSTLGAVGVTPVDGSRYFVDVRAVNRQNGMSTPIASGSVLYDASPPPAPQAYTAKVVAGFPLPQFELALSLPTDPHSAITHLQYAIGTSAGATNVVPWKTTSATTVLRIPVTASMPVSGTYWLQIRAVNAAGLPSTIRTYRFTSTQLQAQ